MMPQGTGHGKAHSGMVHFLQLVHGNGLFQKSYHSRKKRNSQINFGQAEKSPVRAHKAEIKSAGPYGALRQKHDRKRLLW